MRLIRLLSDRQHRDGHLSEAALRDLAREASVPLHRLQQLVSFYPHFRREVPPRVELTVCRDMACWLAGGEGGAAALREAFAGDDFVHVHEASCLGRCDAAPAGAVNECPVPLGDPERVRAWVADPGSVPAGRPESVRRWASDPYAGPDDRYAVLASMSEESPDRVIAELKSAGLRGMGGAGFPTGSKWELVRKEDRTPKAVVCNADESEPGTFKDREILADLPHLVIEGMAIAGRVIGSTKGILYLRHEYGPEQRRFEAELDRARASGVLGDFDIEVFVSPGGYILGEETALLEALEDKRGEPRNKPPFPGTHGLNGLPTLINNVETLSVVPAILRNGSGWWKSQGTRGFGGLKFMAVSGHVERPGVYQVPFGTTVAELIELAGGVSGGRKLLAFAPGGASSNFLPADKAEVPLDFGELLKAGSMLGSGALVVVAEGTDLLALGTNVVKFFRNESCGKCVPCRVGSEKAVAILEGVLAGRSDRTALEVLPELGETMALTSICGLGQVALNPALSVIKNFPEEFGGSGTVPEF